MTAAAATIVSGPDPGGWRQEGCDLMRGVAGGAIVGMPLLYTMEMWWHGMTLTPWHHLALLGGVLVINFLFSLLSGFRAGYSVSSAILEAVTSVGIGIVLSSLILLLIGEIGTRISLREALGKVLTEAAAVSVGVSFANSQIAGRSRTGEEDEDQAPPPAGPERAQLEIDLKDAAATIAGATVFALNIAPTEEVIKIAARLSPWQLLALLCGSVLLCYIILFASGFEQHQVHVKSLFLHPVAETVTAVALSLIVAFLLLLVLGQRAAVGSPTILLAATVTLGLPAVVGGAAGRLVA